MKNLEDSNDVHTWETIHLEESGFVADYLAGNNKQKYGIIILGGSEGGKPTHLACKVAKLGYSVLSLAYFKEGPRLPATLETIPLEYFEKAKNWLQQRKDIQEQEVILIGWSKGAEASLLLSSLDTEYKAIVAIAASSEVWPGIITDWRKKPKSSWSLKGEEIDYLPFIETNSTPTSLTDYYLKSLQNKDISKTTINLKKINIPVLLLSGGKDPVWPSNYMSEIIANELNNQIDTKKPLCLHFNYEEAGHLL
ncbi:MAG: dienelactone hydrolase, partial [Dokdonia sp.]